MTTPAKPLSFARRSLPACTILIALLGFLAAPVAAQPSGGLAAGIFEIDGNLVSEDSTRIDWFAGSFGPAAGVIDPDSCKGRVQHLPAFLDAAFYRDDHWAGNAVDATTFAGGSNKNNDCIAASADPWSLGAGSGPGKTDLTEAYSASYIDPLTGDNWLLLGFATRSTNGDSEMDFEFNTAGLTVSPTQISGPGADCGRTIGDFIVSIDFISGGTLPQPQIYTWDGTTFVPLDTTPAPGEQPRFLVAVNDVAVAAPCNAISPDGTLTTEYSTRQFAEIAINLSAAGVDLVDYCGKPQSTLGFKTRTSAGFSSELKDVRLFPFHLVPSTESTISGPTSLCAHETTTLVGPDSESAPSPLTYLWSTGETTRSITLAADDLGAGAHTVSLVVHNQFGCSDSTAVVVTVHPELQVSVAPVSVCAGETGTLTAVVTNGSGNLQYEWSTGATTAAITVGEAGEYCVTVTDANGCEAQTCATLTVHAPLVVAVENQAVCSGDTGTLMAAVTSGGTAPFTYAWSNGKTTDSITETEDGEYCVTVTDANGCTGQACGTLTVRAALQVSVGNVAVCAGESGTLQANVANGTGPFAYTWNTGATGASIEVSTSGQYSVTVTDANGCEGTAAATFMVREPVQVDLGNIEVCAGETATLVPEVTDCANPITCSWSTGATTPTLAVTESGEYSVLVIDANGCEGRATATVIVHPPLQVTAADVEVCAGESTTLRANVANGEAPFRYEWSDGSTSESISPATSGEYRVTVTDANGCTGLAYATLTVHDVPEVTIRDVEVCEGKEGVLGATVQGGTQPYTYAWSTGETSRFITNSRVGEYSVVVTDANGCEGRAWGYILRAGTPVCEIEGPSWVCMDWEAVFTVNVPNSTPVASMAMPARPKLPTATLTAAVPTENVNASPWLAGMEQPNAGALVGDLGMPAGAGALPPDATGTPDKVGLDDPNVSALTIEWSVSDPEHAIITSGIMDQRNLSVRFTQVGRYQVSLKLTSSAGCVSECDVEVVVLDCDAPGCPRTVGFWGRQCEQTENGDTKFTLKEMYRIVGCVDAHSEALHLGGGPRGFEAFCTLIATDDMNQRHQAKRQFAGMLANVCAGNLGLVASNGDSVRLVEPTPINFPPFQAQTIGDLIEEIDALLLVLEPLSLDDPEVKSQYTDIIRVADAINNARGIGDTCFGGGDPEAERQEDPTRGLMAFKPTPNPFTGRTTILYTLTGAAAQHVDIAVYDIAGRRVRVLESGVRQPGHAVTTWDGRDTHGIQLARGVYYIRGVLGSQRFTTRVVLLRQ